MIGMSAQVNLKGLQNYTKNLTKNLQTAVDQTTLIVQGVAQRNAPVDTGAMKASIFSQTSRSNGLATAMATSTSLNKDVNFYAPIMPLLPFEGNVYVGASYGKFQEYGSSRNRPTFFMTRAAAEVQPQFRKLTELAIRRSTA
jgi:hypothetical protein